MPRRFTIALLSLLPLTLASCGESDGDRAAAAAAAGLSGRPVELVNARLPDGIAGEPEWAHHREAAADLDGDGTPERVVLTANVTAFRGRIDWQDSQQWQVYVQEADGTRTYVYKQLLQLGTLRVRFSRPLPNETPTVVLLEQLPQRLSVYEIRYLGPGRAEAVELVRREFDLRHMFEGTPEP